MGCYSQGYFEAYREVIHEDRSKVSGKSKAPDYSFRLPGGKKLFFVEECIGIPVAIIFVLIFK